MFGRRFLGDYRLGTSKEWITTNGLGGYSSSTVILANTRRYHGLLFAPLKPPWDRRLFLAKLDEEVSIDGRTVALSVNQYPGIIHPTGHKHLKEFRLDPLPKFLYSFGIKIEKSIHMIHGHNALIVSYRILEGGPANIKIYPLVNNRKIHALRRGVNHGDNFVVESWDRGLMVSSVDGAKLIIGSDAMTYHPSSLIEDARWYRNMEYEEERRRGYDFHEDHYSPGFFEIKAVEDSRFNILASAGYKAESSFSAFYSQDLSLFEELKSREEERLRKIAGKLPIQVRHLASACDSFLVTADSQLGVIAGYHWFSTWGRDALVSLPGLCLVTRRFDDALKILRFHASYCRDGVIPNFIGESGAFYNSIDASLWFIYALHKYLTYTDDLKSCEKLWPIVEKIIANYKDGVRLGEDCIASVDVDGLLDTIGEQSQVTWMDAKIGGHAVTPRAGKPVEVNALWYNALKVAEVMSKVLGYDSTYYEGMAEDTKKGFANFWNKSSECLYDVIGKDSGDPSVRPNQLFSVSLPFAVIEGYKAEKVIEKVEKELLTPYGIRSLSPSDEGYIGIYQGDQAQRDFAYHSGTVWSWLMGPYITGFLKTKKYSFGSREEARRLLKPLIKEHVKEAGLGTISEIFDGDLPHHPRGCISQAWGVAEMLRCYIEEILRRRPTYENKWSPG